MKKSTLLIVDDIKDNLIALKILFNDEFQNIITERNPSLIPGIIEKYEIDVILLDMNFRAGINTGNEGIFWMNEILKTDPHASVILITAYGDVDIAVNAMKEGATDFIQKPWDDEKLIITVRNAYKLRRSRQEIDQLKDQKKQILSTEKSRKKMIVGSSPAMKSVLTTLKKVSPTDASILILGENGTGKDMIAREIHNLSSRSEEVFVRVDLGSIAPTLFESELFGQVKGAFTGAHKSKPGRFEIADGGTLFLDEIGNIPMELQQKLLTVIQNREIYRVGSEKPRSVDIRLLCATNFSPEKLVREKKFREDLLYRINTIKIDLPPLRERKEDIAELAGYFLEVYSQRYNKKGLKITPEIIRKLSGYSWPGNIRELQHSIEKAIILSENDRIGPGDFVFDHAKTSQSKTRTLNLEENEKELIETALALTRGNISKASEKLGISRKTLYNKLERYDIEPV